MEVTHVKPHGALNNVACVDTATAEAIARAVFGVSPALIMLAPAASELLAAAERRGLRTASEVFADRQYMADGTLAPRSIPGSVIHDAEEAIEHALRLASVRLTRQRTLDLSLSRAVSPEQLAGCGAGAAGQGDGHGRGGRAPCRQHLYAPAPHPPALSTFLRRSSRRGVCPQVCTATSHPRSRKREACERRWWQRGLCSVLSRRSWGMCDFKAHR